MWQQCCVIALDREQVGDDGRGTGEGLREKWKRPDIPKKSTHTPKPLLPYENPVEGEGSLPLSGPVSSTPQQGKYKYPLLCHGGHSAGPTECA